MWNDNNRDDYEEDFGGDMLEMEGIGDYTPVCVDNGYGNTIHALPISSLW